MSKTKYKYSDELILNKIYEYFYHLSVVRMLNIGFKSHSYMRLNTPGSKEHKQYVANGIKRKASLLIDSKIVCKLIGMSETQLVLRMERLVDIGLLQNLSGKSYCFALPTIQALRIIHKAARDYIEIGAKYKTSREGLVRPLDKFKPTNQMIDRYNSSCIFTNLKRKQVKKN
jgi:hypothetical protein